MIEQTDITMLFVVVWARETGDTISNIILVMELCLLNRHSRFLNRIKSDPDTGQIYKVVKETNMLRGISCYCWFLLQLRAA